MKAKISRGGGFLGALNYVFDVGPKATGYKLPEKVGGNMSGETVAELSKEFGITKKLRPDCKNPVWHCSLTLPEGDRLSSEKWGELAIDFMLEMGMNPSNFLYDVQRHRDTNFDHIHIVASRIGLDGQLWHGANDVFLAIEATQQLEKKHGLTLTPGFNSEHKAERKKVTHKEMNMAIRTGIKPPRMVCQEAIDSVLQSVGVMSAPQFIERLDALGVRAVPSVASTGNMNGYSFETEGVAFTGSKLGESFKWAALQKRGVEYVKDRDFEELANARRLAAERARDTASAGAEQPAAGPDSTSGSELGAVAELGSQPSDTSTIESRPGRDQGHGIGAVARPGSQPSDTSAIESRPVDQIAGSSASGIDSVRQSEPSAAIGAGQLSARNESASSGEHAERGGKAGRSDGGSVEPGQGLAVASKNHGNEHSKASSDADGFIASSNRVSAATATGSEGAGTGYTRRTPPILDAADAADGGSVPGRNAGGDWASRFKKNSAAKRSTRESPVRGNGVEPGNAARTRVAENDRFAARAVDPTTYLESCGFQVKKEGRHLSVRQNGDEMFRVTRQDDGHYVACDTYENGVGDNIALVQHIEPGTGFADSVYSLAGAPSVARAMARTAPAPAPVRQPPNVPAQTDADVKCGRAYLTGRGISLETIERAEQAGMLRYSPGAVLFVGSDEHGTPQNITRRSVDPSETVQKRDLRGTDKRHPQMLPGDPETVWVVEGGVDALAAHDLARSESRPVPTVLVTGGANVRGFLQTAWVQKVLQLAKRVIVAFERESSPEVQAKTDAAHQMQMQRLREVCSADAQVLGWQPPEGAKDVAALNFQRPK